jgi:hypothetical protein
MKEEKWLLRKASGSRSKYKSKGDYSKDKPSDLNLMDELPIRESVKKSDTFMDTGLVRRWLNNHIDKDFDEVYAAFLKRIQPKYLDEYRDCIFWYVERKSEVSFDENGTVYGHCMGKVVKLPNSIYSSFYVDPETNLLKKIPVEQFKREKFTYNDY